MDLYNQARVEHYERADRDRDIAPMADEETPMQAIRKGVATLKESLAEMHEMNTKPIHDWSFLGRPQKKDIVDMGRESDLIDLHEQEAKERDDNFNN